MTKQSARKKNKACFGIENLRLKALSSQLFDVAYHEFWMLQNPADTIDSNCPNNAVLIWFRAGGQFFKCIGYALPCRNFKRTMLCIFGGADTTTVAS